MSYGQIFLNGVNYSGSHVEPNPEVPTGATVTPLSNVKVDEDYFSITGGGGGGSSSDDYSYIEHAVGVWVDGTSFVYEKTINVPSHNGGSQVIDNSLTNANVSYFALKEMSYTVNNSYIDGSEMGMELSLGANGVTLDTNNSALNPYPLTDMYITVRYVKNN